jgi:hypothetical protein
MSSFINKKKKADESYNTSFIKSQILTLEKTTENNSTNFNKTKKNIIKKINGNKMTKITTNKPKDIKRQLEKQINNNNKLTKHLRLSNANQKNNKICQTLSHSNNKRRKKKIIKLSGNNNNNINKSNTRIYKISNPISFSINIYSTKIYDKGKNKDKYMQNNSFNKSRHKSRDKSTEKFRDISRAKSRDISRDKSRYKAKEKSRDKSQDMPRVKYKNISRDLLRDKSRDKSKDKLIYSSIDKKSTKNSRYKSNCSSCISQYPHKSKTIIKNNNIDSINIRNINKINKIDYKINKTSYKKEKIKEKEKFTNTENKKNSKNNKNNDMFSSKTKKNKKNVNGKNDKKYSLSSNHDVNTESKPSPFSNEKTEDYINDAYIKSNNINSKDFLLTDSCMSKNEQNSLNISFNQNIYTKTQSSKSKSKEKVMKKYDYNHLLYKTELNLNSEKNKELIKTGRNSVFRRRESSGGDSVKEYRYNYLSPLNVHRKIFSFKKNEIIDIKNKNNYIVIVKKKCDSSSGRKKVFLDSFYKKEFMDNNNNSDYDAISENSLVKDYNYNKRNQRNLVFYCDKLKQMNVLIKPRKNLELRLFRHSKRNSVI